LRIFFKNTPVCAKVVSKRLPSFWVLVWSCNLCFIPNLSCSHKSGETGYQLMVCRILFWQDFDLMKNRTREGKAQQGKIHTEEWKSCEDQFGGENTKFGTLSSSSSSFLLSLCTVFILTFDLVPSFDKTGALYVPSVWGH
jgi:hypothetical protein